MVQIASHQGAAPVDLDQLIRQTDALITQAVRIDAVTAALLGLAKAELITRRSIQLGEVLRFAPRPK